MNLFPLKPRGHLVFTAPAAAAPALTGDGGGPAEQLPTDGAVTETSTAAGALWGLNKY